MASIYSQNFEPWVNHTLTFLNQDRNSSSCGSFDRYYWGWKKRDFSDSTLQYAILPLLKLGAGPNLDACLAFTFEYLSRIVYPNGSCDQSYPFENHPKIFLDVIGVAAEVALNRNGNFSAEKVDRAKHILRAGVDFSFPEESYGFIANHLAQYAYNYLCAWKILGEDKYYRRAVEDISYIGKNTDSEGWHLEYQGADPGYQTRSLRYLTKCLGLLRSEDRKLCEQLCLGSAEFLDKVVLPDGTLYAMFGSRNTAILYPSGIEFMAKHYGERFHPLAARVRHAIQTGLAILPSQLEFDNFIRLFDDYVDADALAPEISATPDRGSAFALKNYGLECICLGKGYQLFFHGKYGGAYALYRDRALVERNAGFLLQNERTGDWLGTRNLVVPSSVTQSEGMRTVETLLFRSIHRDLTPLRLVAVRLLNLTVLRFFWLSEIFRKVVVRLLIVGSPKTTYGRVTRRLRIDSNSVAVEDSFALPFRVKRVYRNVNLNLFHMASSRYWNPVEKNLVSSQEIDVGDVTRFSLKREISLPTGPEPKILAQRTTSLEADI